MRATSLAEFVRECFDRGCEASIAEVATLLSLPTTLHPFEMCMAVESEVGKLGIHLVPPLSKGSERSARLFCAPQVGLTVDEVRARIAAGEGATSEFKSTMLFCLRTFAQNSSASKAELKSDAVIHGVLKTIAAFLNTSGGSLYVGVGDRGEVIGVEIDFQLLGSGASNDTWELRLRELVSNSFLDGKTVNNLIQVGFTPVDGRTVAHISVANRSKISYLKGLKGNGHEVYVRQGNRTVSLSFPEFEDFLGSR